MSRTFAVLMAAIALMLSGTSVAVAADNPYSSVLTPTSGAGVEVGVPLLVTGGSFNGETGGITAVEVSVDGGANWTVAEGLETWSLVYTPTTTGPLTFVSRASTASVIGNPTVPVTVQVGGAGPSTIPCACGFWLPRLPHRPVEDDADQSAVELGLRVRVSQDGRISKLTVLRSTYQGPLVGRVWSTDGTLLAEQTSGATELYQTITFPTPVAVQAGADYVVSYYTPVGGYAASVDYFQGAVVSAPFTAVHDGVTGAGVYHYGDGGGFPTDSWRDSNYWVWPTLIH